MFILGEITKACSGKLIGGSPNLNVEGVSCDSRTVKSGDLFVALRGPRFDGHAFFKEAFRKGAVCVLADHNVNDIMPLVVVDDTLKALQNLARFHRKRFTIPAIAVAGSAGKTTTKECIGMLLAQAFKVCVGIGNWNNHLGVPLNLFRLSPEDQCLVLEVGANHPGEIEVLCEILEPTIGVITGIYPVHLEGFGSLERIYQAKLELADFLDRTSGTVIANGDDPELVRRLKGRKFNLVTFGTNRTCHYRLSHSEVHNGFLRFQVNDVLEFKLRGYGAFNTSNALAAIAVAGFLGLDLKALSRVWKELPQIEGRFRLEKWETRDIQIVDDSYNANPNSFERAIESFQELAGERRKISIVGDMLELGLDARFYHEALGKKLAQSGFDIVLGVGPLSQFVLDMFTRSNSRGHVAHFQTAQEAGKYLAVLLKEGDSVLIKGSHGIQLDQVKGILEKHFKSSSIVA